MNELLILNTFKIDTTANKLTLHILSLCLTINRTNNVLLILFSAQFAVTYVLNVFKINSSYIELSLYNDGL